MVKKFKKFLIIPIFGTIIYIFYLYIEMIKGNVKRIKVFLTLFSLGFLGFFSILISVLLIKYLYLIFDIQFLKENGMLLAFICGGYAMNGFTLLTLKKEDQPKNIN